MTSSVNVNPLGHTGIDFYQNPPLIQSKRDPNVNDKENPGTQWFNQVSRVIYITTGRGVWIAISASSSPSAGLTWNNNATTTTMAVNNGYIVTNAALQTFTLPVVSAVGDVIELIRPSGAGGWKISTELGKSIQFGSVLTTGETGSIISTGIGDTIHLVCITANTLWMVDYIIGMLNRTV